MLRSFLGRTRQRLGLAGTPGLYYVAPGVNWSLDWDGRYITEGVQEQFGLKAQVISDPRHLSGQILHYGSLWDMAAHMDTAYSGRNQIVGTIFHGQKDDPAFQDAFARVLAGKAKFAVIHTASQIMEQRLLEWGVSADKLVRIPLGVDLQRFVPVASELKLAARERWGVPADAICVGSFHKDGVGMGEGFEPKSIKGPDIFLKVVELVNKQRPIFVLLSAPARGYVKRGLESIGVPYKHILLDDYLQIPNLYQMLDVYLMTSREEGGPKGVLEALACGIPLVATRVGLASDVVTHGENGMLAQSEDVAALASHVLDVIARPDVGARLSANGLKTIQAYDWSLIAARYYREIYKPILDKQKK